MTAECSSLYTIYPFRIQNTFALNFYKTPYSLLLETLALPASLYLFYKCQCILNYIYHGLLLVLTDYAFRTGH